LLGAPLFGPFGGAALVAVTLGAAFVAVAFGAALRDHVRVALAGAGGAAVARAVVVAHAIGAQLDGLFAKIHPARAGSVIPTAVDEIRRAPVIVRARIRLDARRRGLDRHDGIVVNDFASGVRHAPGQGRRERGADTQCPEPSPHASRSIPGIPGSFEHGSLRSKVRKQRCSTRADRGRLDHLASNTITKSNCGASCAERTPGFGDWGIYAG
jgi:hypothetical protein